MSAESLDCAAPIGKMEVVLLIIFKIIEFFIDVKNHIDGY